MFRHKELLGRFEQVSAGSDVLLNVSLVFLLASWLTLPVWTFCILSQGRSSQGSDFLSWQAVQIVTGHFSRTAISDEAWLFLAIAASAYLALACFRMEMSGSACSTHGSVRTQKFSSITAFTSYRRTPNATYLPSRDGCGSKIHAGPTGPLSIVFALPSRLTEAIWNVSPTEPET
jgi:hypothetical protein